MNFSYWEQKYFWKKQDLIICGGGFTGLSAAITYRKRFPGKKVLILEKDAIGAGGSTKNAGFACFGSVSEILSDLDYASENDVFGLLEKRYKGIAYMRQLLTDKAIGYEKNGGYELFKKADEERYEYCLGSLSYLNAQLSEIIGKQVYFGADEKIPEFGFHGVENLIVNNEEGQVDTGKMYRSLLQMARENHVEILNGVEIKAFDESGPEVRLETNRGEISCEQFIIANNGFAKTILPETKIEPARAQVLVTKPLKDLKIKGTFHYDQGYYYFRNIDNRILLGGGRNLDKKGETTSEFGLNEAIQNKLDEMLRQVILPDQPFEIDNRWCGIMGVGENKQLLVEKISERVSCAVRFGGMGVALSTLIGKEIAEMID